ncbi:umecyanin-like [Coffea arabica]|uniref:Umecyanin-like n=1 Tax=Coffea arabica TaxID=13443 RepID=A0A6P6XCF3_COFAR
MSKFGCMVVFCAFSAAMLQQGATAEVYVVGDSIGWAIPQNGAAAYTNWASGKNFKVGDILVFNFVTNQHDVQQVPKASYDACNSNNAIGGMITDGPANVTLSSTGAHYFICTFNGHCQAGQKLAISVSGSAGTPGANPPARTPAPATTPTAPPPPSNQPPGARAPTPSPAPKADGPSAATPTAVTTPPPAPPTSSSNALFAGLGFGIASVAVGLFV